MSDHILVDVIYEMVGCDYLGEIKYPAWRKEVIDAMLRINLSDYTPEQ